MELTDVVWINKRRVSSGSTWTNRLSVLIYSIHQLHSSYIKVEYCNNRSDQVVSLEILIGQINLIYMFKSSIYFTSLPTIGFFICETWFKAPRNVKQYFPTDHKSEELGQQAHQ